jgi:lysozyme
MNALGLSILKSFESCRLRAYQDSGGTWTAGWGSTGEGIQAGVVWSQFEADTRLLQDLAKFENGVRKLVTVHLNEDQLSALIDFSYNEGLSRLRDSTLLADINTGDFDVSDEFKKWIYCDGHVLEGLVGRRAAEACLFASDYTGVAAILDARA